MKWLFLLSLLAVSFVHALPNAEKKDGERLVVRERSKRDQASVGGKAGEGTHLRMKRDADTQEGPGKQDQPKKREKPGLMNLDVDIDINGNIGKAFIDIDVNAGKEGEKGGGPDSENDGEKPKDPKPNQDPCDCVGPLKEQALKLDEGLGSLISALQNLEETGSANNDSNLQRASSPAVAVVESLKGDVNKTVKSIARYLYYYCRYVYYSYYYGSVYTCTPIYGRKRRQAGNGMEPTGLIAMGPTTSQGIEPGLPGGAPGGAPGGPPGGAPGGPPGGAPDGPSGMNPDGPPGMNPDGPSGMNGDGPPGMNQDGPPGMNGDGPPGMNPDGPQGMNGDGPPGMNQDGPMNGDGPPGMNQDGPQGMNGDGPPGMNPDGPPGMNQNPLCIAGDMAGILNDIAEEIKKASALAEQAVNDPAISADVVSGVGDIIDALEEHKKKNEEVLKELEGFPCKD